MCILYKRVGDVAADLNQPRLQGSNSVLMAMELMNIYGVNVLGVECEKDFAGMFRRSDFERHVIRQNLDPSDTTLYEAMSLHPPILEADMRVKEVYEKMMTHRWDYVPIIEEKRLCGIVSFSELTRSVMKNVEDMSSENEMILHYIQGGESYGIANYEDGIPVEKTH